MMIVIVSKFSGKMDWGWGRKKVSEGKKMI